MDGIQPLATFGDLWLWGDDERWVPRGRDFNLKARKWPCETCEAGPGSPCVRRTATGTVVVRNYPHPGRAAPFHSVTALRGGYLGRNEE